MFAKRQCDAGCGDGVRFLPLPADLNRSDLCICRTCMHGGESDAHQQFYIATISVLTTLATDVREYLLNVSRLTQSDTQVGQPKGRCVHLVVREAAPEARCLPWLR
jgi:hypothetical protein